MLVYHGSNLEVIYPNIKYKNYKTDFGKGFYVIDNFEAAKKIAMEKNIESRTSFVTIYEYTSNSNLKILNFDEITKEYLEFINNNWVSDKLLHTYDIVIGYFIEDELLSKLGMWNNKMKTIKKDYRTIQEVKKHNLHKQMCFSTNKALKSLKYIETIKI